MLNFNPDLHQYSVGNEILPSITQILSAEGFVDTTWYTDAGRDRGTIRHLVTHQHDIGELYEDELDPEYLPTLKAYKAFLKDTGFKVRDSEVPRYHKTLKYAGTPDKVGELGKYIAVVEIKGLGLEPWHQIQTAAQAELVKQDYNVVIVKRFSLRFKPDGTYRLEEHANRQDAGIWLSAVAVHNWKRNYLRR